MVTVRSETAAATSCGRFLTWIFSWSGPYTAGGSIRRERPLGLDTVRSAGSVLAQGGAVGVQTGRGWERSGLRTREADRVAGQA